VINPLRNVNTYYNLLCVKRWQEPSPNTYGVIDMFLGLGGMSNNASGAMPVDDPPVRIPKIIFENAMNGIAVDYEAIVISQGADAFYPMDNGSGNFTDSIMALDMFASGTITRQVAASGLDDQQLPTEGAVFDGATAYGEPPIDNVFGGAAHTAKSIVLWIRPDRLSGTQVLWEEGGLTDGLNIYLDNGHVVASAWASAGAGNAHIPSVRSTWPLRLNVWQMVLVVFDFANQIMYIWGESSPGQIANTSGTISFSTLPAHAGDIGVGAANGATRTELSVHDFGAGQGLYYAGGLDNITYYNKTLTRTEINTIWWTGYAGVGAI
jgi:hypothetical protein